MAVEELTIDSVGDLDGGKAREIINRALRDACKDVEVRGHKIRKPRTVTLKINLWPLDPETSEIGADVSVSVKVPPFDTAPQSGQIRRVDGLDVGMAFESAEGSA